MNHTLEGTKSNPVCLNLVTAKSELKLRNGTLELRLVQASSGRTLVGTRLQIQNTAIDGKCNPYEVHDCRKLLASTTSNSLTVVSFHPGLRGCEAELQELAKDRTVVGLGGNIGNGTNIAYVATGGVLHQKAKLSLSTEDRSFGLLPGKELLIFNSDSDDLGSAVKWTVFNCHDYTHVDLINVIQKMKVELIVLVTYNTATRLFWEYATADMHRLFCYVVVVNVAELGGSGVFAPFRQIGSEKNATLNVGGQVFAAKGEGALDVSISLHIRELRELRRKFSTEGFDVGKSQAAKFGTYQPIMPPAQFLATIDRVAGAPRVDGVEEHEIKFNFNAPRIAVAQLNSMELQAYLDSGYRIRNHGDSLQFEHLLSARLLELETRCRNEGLNGSGSLLDLLVLPEVFVPRSYIRTLQGFSNRLGAIVIAGVDYPGNNESENANDCVVLRPNAEPLEYRKISRSQYDAVRPDGTRMQMLRGTKLLRLVGQNGRGIGVLICSDYSHYDLVWKLNLQDRVTPLDMVVVVAHNPFGSLYRSCCIADSHRFYQCIVMCNVMMYGGSGVFAPVRTKGARQVLADIGQGVEAIAMVTIPLEEMYQSRAKEDGHLHQGSCMRKPGVFQSRFEILGPT